MKDEMIELEEELKRPVVEPIENFEEYLTELKEGIEEDEKKRLDAERAEDDLGDRIVELAAYKDGLMEVGVSQERFYEAFYEVVLEEKVERYEKARQRLGPWRTSMTDPIINNTGLGGASLGVVAGSLVGLYHGIALKGVLGGIILSVFGAATGGMCGGSAGLLAGGIVAGGCKIYGLIQEAIDYSKRDSLEPIIMDLESAFEKGWVHDIAKACSVHGIKVDYDKIVKRAIEMHVEEYKASKDEENERLVAEEERKMLPAHEPIDYKGMMREVRREVRV